MSLSFSQARMSEHPPNRTPLVTIGNPGGWRSSKAAAPYARPKASTTRQAISPDTATPRILLSAARALSKRDRFDRRIRSAPRARLRSSLWALGSAEFRIVLLLCRTGHHHWRPHRHRRAAHLQPAPRAAPLPRRGRGRRRPSPPPNPAPWSSRRALLIAKGQSRVTLSLR